MKHTLESCKQQIKRRFLTRQVYKCPCGGHRTIIDEFGPSRTVRCESCWQYSLIVKPTHNDIVIPLEHFGLVRGEADYQRPLHDRKMANALVNCLWNDVWPSWSTIDHFGIDSADHLGALQFAHFGGCSAYDFDRVLGDGKAITQLVRTVDFQPYPLVVFKAMDGSLLNRDWNEHW